MIVMPVREFSVSQIDQVAVSLLEDLLILKERFEAVFACKEAMNDNKGFPFFAITLLKQYMVKFNMLVSIPMLLFKWSLNYLYFVLRGLIKWFLVNLIENKCVLGCLNFLRIGLLIICLNLNRMSNWHLPWQLFVIRKYLIRLMI